MKLDEKNKKIKLFEMFAGYGGASFALEKAGIDYECVGYSEIDKYASQCYDQNHITITKNWGDCTTINPNALPDFDLLTGGFPCQSFSVAGKGLGEQDTRGTLFHEIIRIAEVKKPKYMLLENVKGLTSKKHKATFDKIMRELIRIGYYVHFKILNSKDYGIPQNRERVWFVCIRRDLIDEARNFKFPEPEELKIFLKDILEDDCVVDRNTSYCLDANYFKGTNLKGYFEKKRRQVVFDVSQIRREGKPRVYEGYCKTLNTAQGGGHTPLVLTKEFPKFRKLTPKECFRLMGFLNDEINLEGLSNTQKYKLAGNGWDINIVSKIFKEMFK